MHGTCIKIKKNTTSVYFMVSQRKSSVRYHGMYHLMGFTPSTLVFPCLLVFHRCSIVIFIHVPTALQSTT